ncbi:MAG: O-antigen polymerase [Halarcobacter sp.]
MFFELELIGVNKSLFLHSLALSFSVSISLLFFSIKKYNYYEKNDNLFDTKKWDNFISINKKIFYFSLPFVFLVMYISGGWKSYLGIEGYDRVASMKGMGFLMIFSVLNVGAAILLILDNFYKKRYRQICFPLFSLFILNGFTQGRNNLIWLIFSLFFMLGILNKINKKVLIYFFAFGLLIVFYKVMRYNPTENQFSLLLAFFLHFTGDFDVVIRTAELLKYIEKEDFFGFYHIWSQILTYIPRPIFPDKPHFIGNIYLNVFVFPGVYTGGVGSTGFTFGVISVLYAIYGIILSFLLFFLTMYTLVKFDLYMYSLIKIKKTINISFILYFFLLGNVIIFYREWSTGITNIFFYSFIYLIVYNIFKFNLRYKKCVE